MGLLNRCKIQWKRFKQSINLYLPL